MSDRLPEMRPVSSTNVAAIGYDQSAQNLYIQWKDGRTSIYESVPPLVASDLESAHSVGQAFNQTIKGQYSHRYINR